MMECHHIDGPKCSCNPGYIGDLCLASMSHNNINIIITCTIVYEQKVSVKHKHLSKQYYYHGDELMALLCVA